MSKGNKDNENVFNNLHRNRQKNSTRWNWAIKAKEHHDPGPLS